MLADAHAELNVTGMEWSVNRVPSAFVKVTTTVVIPSDAMLAKTGPATIVVGRLEGFGAIAVAFTVTELDAALIP